MSIVSLAQALIKGPEDKLVPMTITGFDETGGRVGLPLELQFWPETITETMNINWVDKVVAGGSHPLKHWVSNGGRGWSFTMLIARDMKPQKGPDKLPFGVNLLVNPQSPKNKVFNRDIRQDLARLRFFGTPSYDSSSGVTVALPPPILELFAGEIGWGLDGSGLVMTVMTSLVINYQRVFAQGTPRLVTADISFAEIVQSGDQVTFHDRLVTGALSFYNTADAV